MAVEVDQIYVVVDVEADGPVPGLFSMLSIGAVATTDKEEVGSFYRKVLPLDDASEHPPTMEWWKTQPKAWQEVTTDARSAKEVMKEFDEWIESLGKTPLFVAQPVAFDYMFVSWYFWKFIGKNPFTENSGAPSALDLPSFISGRYSTSIRESKRTNLPDWMEKGMPKHSHNALEDARGFAVILRNVLNDSGA